MKPENRRLENLHTLAELEQDGNKTISIDMIYGKLKMERGRTITFYSLVDDKYWKPINAVTR